MSNKVASIYEMNEALEPLRQFVYALLETPKQKHENKPPEREFTPSQADVIATAITLGLGKHSENLVQASEKSDRLSWIAIGAAIVSAFISAVSTIIGGAIASGGWVKLLGW